MDILYLQIAGYVLSLLFIPGLFVYLLIRFLRKSLSSDQRKWYQKFALSKEDAVSQLFLLLSFFFLSITLLSFNRDFGQPFSWRTILLITSIIGIVMAYYYKTIYILLFSLIDFITWWGAQANTWSQHQSIRNSALIAGFVLLFILFYSIGIVHEKEIKYKRFALVYIILGIITVTISLFFLSTKLGLMALENINRGTSLFYSWQISVSIFIFIAFIFINLLYSVRKKIISFYEAIAILSLTLLFCIIALLPQQSMFNQTERTYFLHTQPNLSTAGIFWAILFNLVLFLELFGLIFSGYVRKESWRINLGALFLILVIIVKYFDWFFTFLDKSIFFTGAGILLFVIGYFMEKGRRYILKEVKSNS